MAPPKKPKKNVTYTGEQKAFCVLAYHDTSSPTEVAIRFRKQYGRNAKAPDGSLFRTWYQKFLHTGSTDRKKRINTRSAT